ncbi:hypothetical protein [Microbulbifer sp. GL-2]|uniref:hypothetical protein n=1 Tax=Microbulbifer sp. GL-2 TaxID=2591606 RepID=UPI00116466F6|nr:hypothetical protein [Microbulbifer sp. GL-2]BBL99984.1 hypothetical protein GL2_00590 [Microbulbifer sp. GL-2]
MRAHTKKDDLTSAIKILLGILFFFLSAPLSKADFTSFTGAETAPNIAEIDIDGDKLRINLEISAADAGVFWPKAPPTENIYELAKSITERQDLAFKLYTNKNEIRPNQFSIRIGERKPRKSPFAGKIDPRTGIRMPDLPADKIILLTIVEYPIKGVSHLKILPPLDNDGAAAVTIGFTSRHGKTPISGFHYLSQPESLNIDWKDPWNTRFENQGINRKNRYPLKSFLYVEPRQIRHEILLRPRDLLLWTKQSFNAWQPLTTERRNYIRRIALDYLKNKNPTTIDNETSLPISTETVFLRANNVGYTQIAEDESIEIGSLLIGYREKFHVKELPQSINIDWKIFTDTINSVPTLIQDPAGPFPTHVVPDFPDIQWHNYLYDYRAPSSDAVPIENPSAVMPIAVLFAFCVSVLLILTLRTRKVEAKNKHPILFYGIVLICAGAIYYALPGELRVPLPGTINKKELREITETLLIRLAAAYEEPQTETLKIQLTNLVNGDNFESTTANLSQIYQPLTTSGSLGSLKSINNLKIEHVDQLYINGSTAFSITSKWQAIVEDQSWGHMEQKPREIRAKIEIIQSDNYWKVSAFTSLSVR